MPRPNLSAIRRKLSSPGISVEERQFLESFLNDWTELVQQNPLQDFHPHRCRTCKRYSALDCTEHSIPQLEFLKAQTRLQAAFAGNRFGKTTSMVVKANIQLCDEEVLPRHLLPFRFRDYRRPGPPTAGRIVVPDLTSTLLGVLLPAFRRWTPASQLLGGSFDKAYHQQNRILSYANGSWVQFMTYEMALDKFGGAALHFCGYDEPPPEAIRKECLARLVDYGGFEMFAMTPLMGIGWVYREIYKNREAPNITVVEGSIHDNPTLDQGAKEDFLAALGDPDDPERQSREFGRFMHFGGMVYPGGFDGCLVPQPSPQQLEGRTIICGIDPGLRNAAFVWVAFDSDNRAVVFDCELVQDGTPDDYARTIRAVNEKWGLLGRHEPTYVIDPSARNRSLTNAESVESELQRCGIFPMHGQNDVQVGVQNIRRRMKARAFFVARGPECAGLRSEAEEYRVQDRPDGEFKVVKENDHRLDALRYAVMTHAWDPVMDQKQAQEDLGWRWDGKTAPSYLDLLSKYQPPTPPLGAMS